MYNSAIPDHFAPYQFGDQQPTGSVVLPDDPPTWPALSTPPHSPATLGFISGCLNPNPDFPPVSGSIPFPPHNPPPHILIAGLSGPLHPSSGSFTPVPLLSGHPSVSGSSGPFPSQPSRPTLDSISPGRPRNFPPVRNPKRRNKCFKSKGDDVILRLEANIRLGEAMDFADRVLVGRIRGRNYTAARLKTWATEVWGHHLAEIPFMQTFVRGWFAMRFACVDHTNWVLSSFWNFEHAPVLFKRWTPLFDPETEQIGIGPVWIQLPGLPLHFWSEDVFRRIGDAISTYMDHDKSYLQTGMMAYARILVNLDTRGGLLESITIQWRETTRKQNIDYEGIPYRCRRCHKVGHLYRDFSLIRREGSTDREVEQDLPQEEIPQPHPVQHSEDPGQSLNEGELGSRPEDAATAEHSYAPPPASDPDPIQPLPEHKDLDQAGKTSTLSFSNSHDFCMSKGSVSHCYNSLDPSRARFSSSPPPVRAFIHNPHSLAPFHARHRQPLLRESHSINHPYLCNLIYPLLDMIFVLDPEAMVGMLLVLTLPVSP